MKRKVILRSGIVLALILLVSQIPGFLQFRMNPKEVDAYFENLETEPIINTYTFQGRTINYADIGPDKAQMLIFFHGAPGSWSAFIDFMKDPELVERFRIISVDRPGYGYSEFGIAEPSLQKQAAVLSQLLDLNESDKNPILIGHSLGGPVVARMAMDFPDKVDGIIMVAPSISPELEPSEPWRGPLRYAALNWMLPTSIHVTNEEIFFLKEELTAMIPLWERITVPVIVVQGGEDTLVDPKNADFAEKMITNAPLDIQYYEDVDHFIPWNNPRLITSAILDITEYRE